jgi:hypothetical protein
MANCLVIDRYRHTPIDNGYGYAVAASVRAQHILLEVEAIAILPPKA